MKFTEEEREIVKDVLSRYKHIPNLIIDNIESIISTRLQSETAASGEGKKVTVSDKLIDEAGQGFSNDLRKRGNVLFDSFQLEQFKISFMDGAKWMRSRLSERKIVLPSDGIGLIAKERQEQIEMHGYSIEHDENTNDGRSLALAAATLIDPEIADDNFPMRQVSLPADWKRNNPTYCRNVCMKPYRERLIIAGALIAAELDRIKRLNGINPPQNEGE